MTKYLAMLSDNSNEDLLIFTFFENQTGDRIKFYIVNFQGGFDLEKLKYVALNQTLYNNDYDYYKYPSTKFYEVKIEEYDQERQSVILKVIDEVKNLTLVQLQRESKLKQLFG
jgi:hypothetical protein